MWLFLALVFGAVGENRKIGFWPAFLLCLILSPLIGMIIVLASPRIEAPKPIIEYKCKHCALVVKEQSHYCPRCMKDDEGYTMEQNKERFQTQ